MQERGSGRGVNATRSIMGSLSKALAQGSVRVVEASADEQKMLIFSGSDHDPGVYYIFDRQAKKLQTFLVARDQLEGVILAAMKPITYPASDGTSIPAYLTLPPGKESARGLPAIVMPHGGPSARDSWGFDWLAHEGIADPSKLAIVGWSYGRYAALQTSVVDPTVFKAVVAIAPVTDLDALKDERYRATPT